jgi:hypothetical protein
VAGAPSEGEPGARGSMQSDDEPCLPSRRPAPLPLSLPLSPPKSSFPLISPLRPSSSCFCSHSSVGQALQSQGRGTAMRGEGKAEARRLSNEQAKSSMTTLSTSSLASAHSQALTQRVCCCADALTDSPSAASAEMRGDQAQGGGGIWLGRALHAWPGIAGAA